MDESAPANALRVEVPQANTAHLGYSLCDDTAETLAAVAAQPSEHVRLWGPSSGRLGLGRGVPDGEPGPPGAEEELQAKPADPAEPYTAVKPWKNFGKMRRVFEQVREQVGEIRYLEELELAGVQSPGQFQTAAEALEGYEHLTLVAFVGRCGD